jgi:hypothetical protein
LRISLVNIICAFSPSQCALAADEVVFNKKELEVKELKNQVQVMVRENKQHIVSLKEAQKVNRLQVGFLSVSSSVDVVPNQTEQHFK